MQVAFTIHIIRANLHIVKRNITHNALSTRRKRP
nr:MAG TPA: hypothetical protein [Caudoviricetes sp.]